MASLQSVLIDAYLPTYRKYRGYLGNYRTAVGIEKGNNRGSVEAERDICP